MYCLHECHRLQPDTLLGGQCRSTFTFLPHKFPNSPVKSREDHLHHFCCCQLISKILRLQTICFILLHSLFWPALCAQWGKQLLSLPQLAPFVKASMVLRCIKHGPDTPRHQPCPGTQVERRCLQSSMSLAWTSICLQDRTAPVAMGEFQGILWSKAQKLNDARCLPSNGELGFWINLFVPRPCLAFV